MSGKEKMILAMRLMSMVCEDITDCDDCPFESMCDCLSDNDYRIPSSWKEMLDFKENM